jgi:hypothetical protein
MIALTNEEKKILDYFTLLKRRQILGTSYIFVGDNFLLVKKIMKLVACLRSDTFCNQCWDCLNIDKERHPDLLIVEPEPNIIRIERVRESRQFLSLKSFRLKYKLLLIKEGEFSPESASCLLKTLEEPPRNSFIVICVSKTDNVPLTILSRCRKVFLPIMVGEKRYPFELVSEFLRGKQVKFKSRRDLSLFLEAIIVILRDYIVKKVNLHNMLIKRRGCDLIKKEYSIKEASNILENILGIYKVSHNINENLALNLIRMKLDYGS